MVSRNLAISVNNLKKSYKTTSVLDGITFEIEKGMIFSLLGSNGAGKTTTIKILTTLLSPDAGEVTICGHSVTRAPARVRDFISLTGQYACVDEALSGFENLVLMGKLNHIAKPKERAGELLKYFDLEEAANRLVSGYSGGMRRKLDIAMSLVGKPEIIFLDEPTTGLDPQSRHSMWKIIRELNASGITIFLTTQYLEEAEQLAEQIAILNKGKIVTQGSPSELKKMLPQGIIEFTVSDRNMLKQAAGYLPAFKTTLIEEENKLIVYSDGSAAVLEELFRIFSSHAISIREFSQKLPSLEDVFLTLIGEREEGFHE